MNYMGAWGLSCICEEHICAVSKAVKLCGVQLPCCLKLDCYVQLLVAMSSDRVSSSARQHHGGLNRVPSDCINVILGVQNAYRRWASCDLYRWGCWRTKNLRCNDVLSSSSWLLGEAPLSAMGHPIRHARLAKLPVGLKLVSSVGVTQVRNCADGWDGGG